MAWRKYQWQTRVRALACENSNVVWSEHARIQLHRRGISMEMAVDVISKGTVQIEPEVDIRTGHTVCRMERFSAGKHVAICVALESQIATKCIVVTVMERTLRA